MNSLVFVCEELLPHPNGSGGQALFEMLCTLDADERARTVVLVVDGPVDQTQFAQRLSLIELVTLDSGVAAEGEAASQFSPPIDGYTNTPFHWRSACVFRALARLNERRRIDYVEFPDFGGLGFCTMQERRLQGFLADASLAVRLGTSHTARMNVEPMPRTLSDLNLSDLERKCLRDCDVVIAPNQIVSDQARGFFDISKEEWDPRIVFHMPPRVLDSNTFAPTAAPAFSSQPIVYFSGAHRFQRLDLFVRGVAGFMQKDLDFLGSIIVAADLEESVKTQMVALLPKPIKERINFQGGIALGERVDLIRKSTVVISSGFDPICIDAFEASLLGARLILNEKNVAFGAGSPWVDGVNCIKFDGSVSGLVGALERNFTRKENLLRNTVPSGSSPWGGLKQPRPRWRSLESEPLVSVVVPHYNLGRYLLETLRSLSEVEYASLEVIVVDDASTDAESINVIEQLIDSKKPGLKVIRLAANVGLAGARNVGVKEAIGSYVLTLDADDLIHPRFIPMSVEALENNIDFDLVVTPAGYFLSEDVGPGPGGPTKLCGYAVFSGEAVLAGLLENRFSTATALFRNSMLKRFPYDESLNCYEDWSLFMRMCDSGVRFIVTTDVFFFYRLRFDSMVHAPRNSSRKKIEYSDMLRTGLPASVRHGSKYLALGLVSPVAADLSDTPPPPLPPETPAPEQAPSVFESGLFGNRGLYDEPVVFASLKVSRWLERRAPYILEMSMKAARRIWRLYRTGQSRSK